MEPRKNDDKFWLIFSYVCARDFKEKYITYIYT